MAQKECVLCGKVITKTYRTTATPQRCYGSVNWRYLDHLCHQHRDVRKGSGSRLCPICGYNWRCWFHILEQHIEKQHTWEEFDKAIVLAAMGGGW